MKKLASLFILVSLLGSKAFAFDMPIEVDATINDDTGRTLFYFLKEEINKSSSMHITYKDEFRLTLSIVTIPSIETAPQVSTTYSIAWVISRPHEWPIYLTSSVGNCGRDRIRSCTDSLVARAYQEAEKVYRMLSETATISNINF